MTPAPSRATLAREMRLIIFGGCQTCPFAATDISGESADALRIEHACRVKDDRIILASDDLASELPTVPPRWCPMRLEQIVVQLDVAPDRTSN
jgi:hypothetical protein